MSERNVEVVRSLLEPFQAINTAEIDWGADVVREALAAKCSPDIEVRTLDSGIGTGIPHRGRRLEHGSLRGADEGGRAHGTRALRFESVEDR